MFIRSSVTQTQNSRPTALKTDSPSSSGHGAGVALTPPPPAFGSGAGVRARWGGRGVRRWLGAVLAVVVLGSLLAVVPVGLPLAEGPSSVGAQQVASQAVLHRGTIVEGQTRVFRITDVPTRPEYYLHASVAGSFSAEAADVTITTDNLLGQALAVTPDADGPRAYPDSVYGRIRFEVTANADSDGAGDETFGVRLCTTADCVGGTVLGEWTVTITEPEADTTLTGTGATLTVHGGSALSVMEDSANGDGRDRRATFSIDVTTAPTSDVAIVAYTETGVSTGTRTAPFARINSALSPDYPPHGETAHDDVRAEYLVGYWASGATGSQDFTVISTDNAVDSAGGTVAGNLKFKVYVDNEAFRTTLSGTSSDTAYGNATAYTAIAVPDLPVRVTDDDEPTRVRLLPASPADNTATEGATDKAAVRVRLDRALAAGEEVTALLTFSGAALGTNFSLAAQSGQTGVSYADSGDGAQGLVTLAGAGVQEGVIEVTALADGDSVSQTLQIGMPPTDQPWRANFLRSNLDGGVCAAHGCPDRPQGDPGERFQSVTLAEAAPGLAIIENEDPDLRVVTEGMDYSYTLQLNTAPSNDVTVATTISSGGSVQAGGTLTFTNSNWAMPQTVTVTPTNNSADEPRRTLTVTHALSGDTAYAALADVAHSVTVLDDDATTVTMAGAGVRDPANSGTSTNISRVMVEGDATRVDRSLTVTLGRALVDGEYVRVPLRVEAVANGNDPSLPDDPPDSKDGDPPLPGDLDPRRTTVDSFRGPRASADVAWPPQHNDVVMTATGTGVTYEHSNRYTPNHVGFRYVEFRGAGAQTATVVVHAKDGFDDGETYDEAFAITFPRNFRVFDADTDQPLTSAPVDTNLGGGVTAAPVDGEAWFGIDDDDKPPPVAINAEPVPHTSPLVPGGLSVGDSFRLLFVTRGETAATTGGTGARAHYDNFVRAEITGSQLKQGGVPDLRTHASKFVALITTNDGNNDGAEDAGMFRPHHLGAPPLLPDVPVYWVGGNKIADDRADFTDGDWDDETDPRHADGSAATIDTDGYWTGSKWHGGRRGGPESDCAGGFLRAGESHVNVGKLNDSTLGPLGPDNSYNGCDHAQPSAELRPLFAMTSSVFVVTGPTVAVESSEAAEGSPVQFTVTLSEALSNAVTVPYTVTDGRGVTSDPAHIVAAGASGGTGADYDNDAGTITIAAGQTTGTISITTTDDSTYEGDHYFTVALGTPTGTDAPGIDPEHATAVGTITDDADKPTIELAATTAAATEGTDTQVTLTATKTGATLVESSVYWTTADGAGNNAATHPDDYTANAGHLRFAPGDTTKTITVSLVDDSTGENAETFNVRLDSTQIVDAQIGTNDEAAVTVTDDDGAPGTDVNVTMSASDGDSDGNAVENGAGAAGYRTITVTLSRALTGAETVTVPLTVRGATVGDDYTFGLAPATQTGVTLLSSGATYTAQNPALRFVSGGQTATLRLTPVQNNRRSQPAVSISAGILVVNGVTAGEVSGGPIVFSIVDDESGVIEVPATFGLAPAGLSAGDRFRLIFITSQTRTAESADIDDYNRWVQGVVARNGHADLLPYGGLVKVIGSTASVDARENTGMWDPDANSGSGGYTDGSASASNSGVTVYWLAAPPANKVADNYFDFYDSSWDGGYDQTQEDTDEAGDAHSGFRPFFTGTNDDGTADGPLGGALVTRGSSDSDAGDVPINGGVSTSSRTHLRLMGISPVFEVEMLPVVSVGLPPVEGVARVDGRLPAQESEGATGVGFEVSVDPQQTAALTVCVSVAESGGDRVAAGDEGVKTVTIPANSLTGVHTVTWADTAADDRDSVVTVTAVAPGTAGCTGADSYTVAPGAQPADPQPADSLVVQDDEQTVVSLTSTDADMSEEDPSDTAVLTVSLSRRLYAGESIDAVVALTTSTGAALPGSASPDFSVAVSGAGVTATGTSTANVRLVFTGHDTNTVQTATVTLTPVSGRDDGDTGDEMVAAALNVLSGTGTSTVISGGAAAHGSDNSVAVTIDDDDVPGTPGITVTPGDLRVLENGTATYTIALDSEPTADVTLAITRAGANSGAATVSPASHTFTAGSSGNWSTALTVTVSGVDEPNQNRHRPDFDLSHAFTSSDSRYAGSRNFTKTVPVGDAPEIEVWEMWRPFPRDAKRTDHSLRRPGTVTGKAEVIPGQEIVANALGYKVTISSRPAGTVTVTATVNDPNIVGIALTRDGAPQDSLTLTFEDRDPDPGCHYAYHHENFYYDNDGNRVDGTGEDYDATPDTSWKCARTVFVFKRVPDNVNGCTDITHTVSGGGARSAVTAPHSWASGLMRAYVWAGGGYSDTVCDPITYQASGAALPVVPKTAHQVPAAQVSGLTVADVDANTATATWTAVPNATSYDVRYAATTYNGRPLEHRYYRRFGRANVTGTSWTFTHNTAASADFRVHVTPVYKPARAQGVWEQTFRGLAATTVHTVTRSLPQKDAAPAVPDAAPANVAVHFVDAATAKVTWDPVEHADSYYVAYEGTAADPLNDVHGAVNGHTETSWTFAHNAAEKMVITVTVTPQYTDGNGAVQRLHSLAASADLDLADPACDTADAIDDARAAYAWHTANNGGSQTLFWQILAYLGADPLPDPPGGTTPDPTTPQTVETFSDNKPWNGWEPIVTAMKCIASATTPAAAQHDDPPAAVPEISITADADIGEGDDAVFTITADPAPAAPLDVTVTIAQTGDHGATTGTRQVTVPTSGAAGLTVATADDSTDEPDGTITAAIGAGAGYTVSATAGAAAVAVADDDVAAPVCVPSLPSDAVTVSEATGWRDGHSGTAHVKRWNRVLAALGADTGETAMTVAQSRSNESKFMHSRWDRVTRTLEALEQCDDNDPAPPPPPPDPEISITARSDIDEGGNAAFTITADPAPTAALTVTVAVAQTGDHGATTGTRQVTVPASGAVTLTVATTDDSTDEPDGTITATIDSGSGYTVSAAARTATVAIADNDPAPAPPPPPDPEISITARSDTDEGGTAVFTITADPAPTAALTVTVTVSQTGDFGATPGTRTITIPTSGSATLTVTTTNDSTDEPDGTVTAAIDSGNGYTVSAAAGTATVAIADDDVPQISIAAGAGITEGATAVFTITADPAPAAPLTVDVTVAQSGDHGITPGSYTVTVPTSGTATLTVATTNDSTDEPDGSITATVGAGTGYTVSATAGTATIAIADDDNPPPPPSSKPTITVDDATAGEGDGAVEFTVRLSTASTAAVTVYYAANPGTAMPYADYLPDWGQITFAPGDTTKNVQVSLIDDRTPGETDETLVLKLILTDTTHATLTDDQAQGTITDND